MDGDDVMTAFPAVEETPGQTESRTAYRRLMDLAAERAPGWWEEYLELREAGWTWRKAVYIAWMSVPAARRWPGTQQELAVGVLGLKSDRVMRRWRRKDERIDNEIALRQAGPLLAYRADVFEALGKVASEQNSRGHQDRKLFFEMTGDYRRGADVQVEVGRLDAEIEKELERLGGAEERRSGGAEERRGEGAG